MANIKLLVDFTYSLKWLLGESEKIKDKIKFMLTPYIASSSPNMKSSYEPRMSSPEIDLMNENHLFIDIPF